jgi:hypothetical protein
MDGSGQVSRDSIERTDDGSRPLAVTTDTRHHGPRRSTLTIAVALILAAVAAMAAVVTGGAGASGSKAGAATTPSPKTLPAVQTVAFTVSATLTNGATTHTLLTGNGAADFTNGEGTTTLTIPALSGLLGSNDTVNAVWQGTNLYLEVPALSAFLGGKSWVEVSLAGVPGISSLSSTVQSYLSDPSKLAGVVTSLGGTVTDLGPQSNGTTEYQATIPVAGIVSDLKHSAHQHGTKVKGSSIKPFVKDLHQLGSPTITADAWVAGNGQLTQVSVTVHLGHAAAALGSTIPGAGAGSVLTLTVGLSYGAPVSVTVPPASDVASLGNVLPFLQSFGHLGSLAGLAARI